MKSRVFVTFLIMTVCMSLFTLTAQAGVTDDNPYNVALGKTVVDVNNVKANNNPVSNLTDGDSQDSNRFGITSSKLDKAIIEIDLAAVYTISGVDVLSGYSATGAPAANDDILSAYQVHYLSGEEWVPARIAGGTDMMGNPFTNERVTVLSDGCTVNCRYGYNFLVFDENVTTNKIRIVSKDTDAKGTLLREIRVYKADDNNVAFRKPVTISWASFGGGSSSQTLQQVPSFVVDGQSNNTKAQEFTFGSKASVSTTDHWVQIDLLKNYNINRAVVSTGTTKSFRLQAYENGEWTDIPGAGVENNTSANRELTFPVYTTNKVRLFLPKGQSSQKIKEIKLYAVDDIVVDEFGYKSEGEIVECLVENADFTGSMKVTNNSASAKNATYISALYEIINGIEELKAVQIDSKEIAGGGVAETLQVNMKLPANVDNCILRTFLFDTLDDITPYFSENKFPAMEKDVLEVELIDIKDNQWIPDTATVEVQASYGTKAVRDVELYLDDTRLQGEYNNGVYSAKLPDGIMADEHTLYAKAIGEDYTTASTESFNVNVYDASKIVVKQTNNFINFYIKGSNESSNRYIRHILRRHTVTPTATDAGVDLWRLFGSYDVERVGEYEFTDIYDDAFVTYGVEWECALEIVDKDTLIPGKSDTFIGGYHKNEFVDEATIVVKYDGEAIDVSKTQNLLVDKIEITEVSDIHIGWPVSGDVVVEHSKQYEITPSGGIKVVQGFDWKKAVELKSAYITMLPIQRQFDDGTQITDRAMRDDNGNGLFDDMVYDVTYGNNTSIDIAKAENNIFASKIWGEKSGISVEVNVAYDPVIETNDFFVSMYTQNNGYNKFYYDYCDKYTPKVGEKWNVTTTYKFDVAE